MMWGSTYKFIWFMIYTMIMCLDERTTALMVLIDINFKCWSIFSLGAGYSIERAYIEVE